MIENIKNKAYSIDWNDFNSISKFYENNRILFDNYKILNREDDIIDIIHMKAHYVAAMISKNRYTKALEVVEHIDFLLKKIDSNSELYRKLDVENKFHSGVLNGYLKNYKKSFELFSELIRIDPENDLYKDWYSQMKINLLTQKFRVVGYIGVILVFGDIISGLAFNYNFEKRLVLLGFSLILLSWLIPQGAKYLNKRKILK